MQIPILTYHAVNIIANNYEENDHIALAADLRVLQALGYKVVSLSKVFEWHQGKISDDDMHKTVAISLDDGSWFDFYDLNHPSCGMQPSMLSILKEFQKEVGYQQQPELHATSFVISSPLARDQLDKRGLIGQGWWGDEWWVEASNSGLMSIECHSWDHNHPDLDDVAQVQSIKGNFLVIDTLNDCNAQVAEAGDYIEFVLSGVRPKFFAFPWGQASEYMLTQYLPKQQQIHQFIAAFNTEPRAVQKEDNKWALPRYVFGRDWKNVAELEAILIGSETLRS